MVKAVGSRKEQDSKAVAAKGSDSKDSALIASWQMLILLIVSFLLRSFIPKYLYKDADTFFMERLEISTPANSYKRLKEGLYLFQKGISPYEGDTVHQPPLLLLVFVLLDHLPIQIDHAYIFILVDLLIGLTFAMLADIVIKDSARLSVIPRNGSKESLENNITFEQSIASPLLVCSLYLLNPYTLLSCIGKSTTLFDNLAILLSIFFAMKGRPAFSAFFVAVATYLGLYPIVILSPILLLSYQRRLGSRSEKIRVVIWTFVAFLIFSVGLQLLSYDMLSSWNYVYATYGLHLGLFDFHPNVGMFWYFFIEVFDQFRTFFLYVFQLHFFCYLLPATVRLRRRPLFLACFLCGVMATFRSYPSISDASLFWGFIPLFFETRHYMKRGFLVFNLFLYASVLGPIFWDLWIYQGSGNANFFYSITLLYGLAHIFLLIDCTFSQLRKELDEKNQIITGMEVYLK